MDMWCAAKSQTKYEIVCFQFLNQIRHLDIGWAKDAMPPNPCASNFETKYNI